jgi:hypothetical protein
MSIASARRRDLHNTSVDYEVATQGLCGFIHIPTGRVCRLPYRHAGPCHLRPRHSPASERTHSTWKDA